MKSHNKIAIFSMVKDECDFIDKFLDHNLEIADEMIVIDNGSKDGTLEILKDYGNRIRLVEDRSRFNRKGRIQTKWMLQSDAELLVSLDADELIVFDDGEEVSSDPSVAREYLKGLEVEKNDRFQVRKIYMKHPEDGWWEVCRSNKRILARDGFKGVDAGSHGGHMEENRTPKTINVSYLHYHFRSKQAWLRSSEKKLRAEFGGGWENLGFLKTYRGHSHHVGRELIRYRETGIWHNVKKQLFNEALGVKYE